MGNGSTVALNVNASSFTVGPVTETNSLAGGGFFTPSFKQSNIGFPGMTVDGFGRFNLTVDNNDGYKSSATNVQFTLTNTSGTWVDALAVLGATAQEVKRPLIYLSARSARAMPLGRWAAALRRTLRQFPFPGRCFCSVPDC